MFLHCLLLEYFKAFSQLFFSNAIYKGNARMCQSTLCKENVHYDSDFVYIRDRPSLLVRHNFEENWAKLSVFGSLISRSGETQSRQRKE